MRTDGTGVWAFVLVLWPEVEMRMESYFGRVKVLGPAEGVEGPEPAGRLND